MADQSILEDIETGELIIQVDAGRPAGDPFKLPADLHTLVQTRLTDTITKNAAATMAEGSTAGASVLRSQALTRLNELLHNAYNHIGAIPSDDLSEADRAHVYTAYGWAGGVLGDLQSTVRVEQLANLASSATADASVPAAGKYPAGLVTRIANWLATFDAASLIATGGNRQVLIAQRNAAGELLHAVISRVRLFYGSASDDGDQTPELAKIGMQPRRDPGDAQPLPAPDAPGTATFNPATRELTIPAMPNHATFLRCYRQPAGGPETVAGVSNTTTVSAVGFVPLTPGVTYDAWVVGANSRGEGPASNRITFTA